MSDDELEQLQNEGAQIDGTQAFPGGDDGDPGTAPQVEAELEVKTADVLYELLIPTFDLLAPAWDVKREEQRALADAYGTVLDKYFPAGITKWGAELNAIVISVMVFYPRRGMPTHKAAPAQRGNEPIDGEVVKKDTNGQEAH